jgi:hypothetical protein
LFKKSGGAGGACDEASARFQDLQKTSMRSRSFAPAGVRMEMVKEEAVPTALATHPIIKNRGLETLPKASKSFSLFKYA